MSFKECERSSRHAWLDLLCTSTSERRTVRLNLRARDSHVDRVSDLQQLLQSEHHIPVCDQRWRCNSQILDGKETLDSLYFRSGDTFEVSYLAAAATKELESAIHILKEFRRKIKPLTLDWEHTSRFIEKITFEQFLPWKDDGSLANRHYFHQQGGLDVFFDTFHYVQKTRQEVTRSDDDNQILFSVVLLEMVCLELLWNFSETDADRRLMMQYGGLDMAMKSLVASVENDSEYEVWFDQGQRLADVAVGCIVQYCEYADAQMMAAKNVAAMKCLVEMVFSDGTYSLYSCQIAANTLFCCSCLAETHPYLVSHGICQAVVDGLNRDGELQDMAVRYFCCCFLAQLQASRLCLLDGPTYHSLDTLVQSLLLDTTTPLAVSEFEQSHTYVWVTLLPFLDLAFKSGKELTPISQYYWDAFGIPDYAIAIGSRSTQAVGLFCLDQLCLSEDNRKLFIVEGLLGYFICLCWSIKDWALHNQATRILKRFGVQSPPSLRTIASSCLASYVGLSAVNLFVSRFR